VQDTSSASDHAQALGAKLAGWSFLMVDMAEIRKVERLYGAFAGAASDGNIDVTPVNGASHRQSPDALVRSNVPV
jgi:hypothetical protein